MRLHKGIAPISRAPLVGEHARSWRAEGGYRPPVSLLLTPLPIPPPQGGRGEGASPGELQQ